MFYFPEYHSKVKKALKLEREMMLRLEREITPKLGHLSLKEGARVRNFPSVHKQTRKPGKIRCILTKRTI